MSDQTIAFTPYDVADHYLQAVVDALAASGAEPVALSYVGVGTPALDGRCGQLVVVPAIVYKSDPFPAALAGVDECAAATIAVQLDVTMTRCVPTIDAQGRPPKPEAIASAHATIMTDQSIVWAAMNAAPPVEYEWETALHSQQPIDAQGGVAGFVDSITVGIEPARWCAS